MVTIAKAQVKDKRITSITNGVYYEVVEMLVHKTGSFRDGGGYIKTTNKDEAEILVVYNNNGKTDGFKKENFENIEDSSIYVSDEMKKNTVRNAIKAAIENIAKDHNCRININEKDIFIYNKK